MNKNVNTDIYDKVLDRSAMIRLYERRVSGKVTLLLDGHIVRLDELIKSAERSDSGLKDLFRAVDDELTRTYKDVFSVTKNSLTDFAVDQLSFMYQNIESMVGKIWKTKRPQRRVAEEFVLSKPLFNDKTLLQGWAGVSVSERKRLEAVLRQGIAAGLSIEELARNIRSGNLHNITRFQSKALVVTAITSVHTQADHAIYKANAKALQGWQYVAVLDARTTQLCAHRDGHVYDVEDTEHLPPAHFHCRSTTTPIFKSYADIANLEGVAQVRRRNLERLNSKRIAYYDGISPLRESYNDWLKRQPTELQIRHLGGVPQARLFQEGKLTVDGFTNSEGNSIGIRELRAMTSPVHPGDVTKFADAKTKLDSLRLWATNPDDFISDAKLAKDLKKYYLLQAGELDGVLSLTNYRGVLLGTKRATKNRVLNFLPTEAQLRYNPITRRYEDTRLYQPNPYVLADRLRLVEESEDLLPRDRVFIKGFVDGLADSMGDNERAVVADNLRIVFGRSRINKEPWIQFKGVAQGQIKFDVMNVTESMETQIRKGADVLKKLQENSYIDPVLGPTQLKELHDEFIANILAKNNWEDKIAPKIAAEMRPLLDTELDPVVFARLSGGDLQQFYLKLAHRLSLADSPDRDQLAVALGRDLYNLANLNGSRRVWYKQGMKILDSKNVGKFFELDTFGVQKRRMKSRLSNNYFGPYYDTLSFNIKIVDPRIRDYAVLTRKVELGLRVPVIAKKNRLVFREGYKTYFIDRGILGFEDTRIPITSTSSFSDFPDAFIDKPMVDALNWAGKAEYKIDDDFHSFVKKILYFEDDKGMAKHYAERNEYRKYLASRGDAYERLKAMDWLSENDLSFSNNPFIDHRARIYDRGLIGPQSGESFRPFLNTKDSKLLGKEGFLNFQDQVGAFLGGLNDSFEGRYDSLTVRGRQLIAEKWRPELVKLGQHMLRGKPADIRAILDSEFAAQVEGEELGKFYRFAMETAKLDNFVGGDYRDISKFDDYSTALALEQDASSSGAQIIALTTRNKQLAELSNVVPTTQKKRLYDEIAAATFHDPRFKLLNEKLGLTEKDLRKAAKAQNMVVLYGAGERTGILNVEGKLAKVLGKENTTLVVRASDREAVLNEISARMARFEKFDLETAAELRRLRNNVKDVFNKGLNPGDDIMEQLYFLDPKTRDLVEKMTTNYDRIVTPDDFKAIAKLMSEHLREQVPVLKDFTRFFGRLAEDFLKNAKPSDSAFDWVSIAKTSLLGTRKSGYKLPPLISRLMGLPANVSLSEQILKKFDGWVPNGSLADIFYGVLPPEYRRTGYKYRKLIVTGSKVEVLYANKLPKSWTNVPWVNFDGSLIEQNFTQTFEERLTYKNSDGIWTTNILQVPQKTEATWWEQMVNDSGKINDIADVTKARTAFAVNANHSNDATIVKNFHLWGKLNNVYTSTIHDAFFANAAEMLKARSALRGIYARTLSRNVIEETLLEMKKRGLPKELYDKYRNEAIDIGLIPIAGRSRIGGKLLEESDILKPEDILKEVPDGFKENFSWYGVG